MIGMRKALHNRIAAAFALALFSCTPGGIIDKGGYRDQAGFIPAATRTRGAPYKIVCYDDAEARRREALPADAEKPPGPPVRYVAAAEWFGGCEEEGESSVFLLFNMFPVTPPISPEYAVATAVQRLEGDTMIGIRTWHETHYYSILGRVSVFKVKGRVIKFLSETEQEEMRRGPAPEKKDR
jgi:hypothetical protein